MENSQRKGGHERGFITLTMVIVGTVALGLVFSSCTARPSQETVRVNAPTVPLFDKDRNELLVNASLDYRITEPDQFRRTLHTENNAHGRLADIALSVLRDELASRTHTEALVDQNVASGSRFQITDLVLQSARTAIEKRTTDLRFGIEITDLSATATYRSK